MISNRQHAETAKPVTTQTGRAATTTDKTEKRTGNLKPFKKGAEWTGNAEGRPKGARNRLCTQYIEDLHTVWKEEGIKAIRTAAKKRPVAFIHAVGNLVPREFDVGESTGTKIDLMSIWRAAGDGTLARLFAQSATDEKAAPDAE